MNYYVIAADGRRYGPADVATLQSWAQEGRVTPTTQLEEEGTGRRLPAAEVPGLGLAPTAPPSGAQWSQPPAAYYRTTSSGAGQGELVAAWILGACTFLICCPVLPGLGVYFANKALQAGADSANAAKVFNVVVLILSCLLYVAYGILFGIGMASGFH